jgi:hypothetical protein
MTGTTTGYPHHGPGNPSGVRRSPHRKTSHQD